MPQDGIAKAGGGGFVTANDRAGLLSPAPSTSTAPSSVSSSMLPKPRRRPLKPGGAKETTFINYMDREIMGITRRFATRKGGNDADPDTDDAESTRNFANRKGSAVDDKTKSGKGYESFKQVAKDVDRLLAVLWVSATPSLQIQYLLTLALLVITYIPSFAPSPRAMFRVLEKLDYAFASLVTGQDAETGEALPGFGFGGKRGLTATEKVRVRSLVERTRVGVVEVMGRDEEVDDDDEEEADEEEDGEDDMIDVDDFGDDWVMEIARVYNRTLVELGDTLGETEIEMVESERVSPNRF